MVLWKYFQRMHNIRVSRTRGGNVSSPRVSEALGQISDVSRVVEVEENVYTMFYNVIIRRRLRSSIKLLNGHIHVNGFPVGQWSK